MSAVCGEENHFTIDGSGSSESGRPEVTVSGAKSDLHVKLKNVGYNLYQVIVKLLTQPGFFSWTKFWKFLKPVSKFFEKFLSFFKNVSGFFGKF